jgi:hypothetical protein
MNDIYHWWRKQNTSLRVAYIGGAFSIVAVVLSTGSTILSAYIEKKIDPSRAALPKVSVEYKSFGGERFLYASNVQNSSEIYDITTKSCLKLRIQNRVMRTQAEKRYWSGRINTLITSDLPIVIIGARLEVFAYKPIRSNLVYDIVLRQRGQEGGPGAFVSNVNTNSIIIGPDRREFELLSSQPYELPANGAVMFSTPVTLTVPGHYYFKIKPMINTYSKTSMPFQSANLLKISWIDIPRIEPSKIKNPYEGLMQLHQCGNVR